MKVYKFEKKGIMFSFRNPTWDEFYNELRMEWKVVNIKENKENDGYYYNSTFLPNKKAMRLYGVTINGQEIEGVILPDNILKEIETIYKELKEEDLQKKLNKDIKYKLNQTFYQGNQDGISELDIRLIINDIKKKLNGKDVYIDENEIAKILTKDKELEHIAWETYRPIPEGNWVEQYLNWFREAAKEKKAPGYGLIPNSIIRQKITEIIKPIIEEENRKKQEEEERINNLFKLAKETGEKQLIREWVAPCNDKNEECSWDFCYLWAMPDGTKKVTRIHAY